MGIEHLNGKIKILKSTLFKVEDVLGKIEKVDNKNDKNGFSGYQRTYTFNKEGNIVEEKYYKENGELLTKKNFFYDEYARLIQQVNFNARGELTLDETFRFEGKLLMEHKRYSVLLKKKLGSVEKYQYDMNNNLIEKSCYNQSNNLLHKDIFKYDEFNNKVKQKSIGGDRKEKQKRIWRYNKDNKVVQFMFYNSLSTTPQVTKYKYDALGNLIEKNDDISGRTIFIYDSQNMLIEETWFSSQGKLGTKIINKYYLNGNIQETRKYDPYRLDNLTISKFKTNGLMIEQMSYDQNGKLFGGHEYLYNSNSDVIFEKSISNYNCIQIETNDYIYDEMLNPIKKIRYRNGIPYTLRENDIIYY